jgi:hypothetical protein
VDTATGALAELFTTGRPGAPVIAPLGGGELLLLKDSVGLAVGADGRPARRPPLNWSDTPAAVAVSAPYALALLPGFVEVRGVARAAAGGPAQVRRSRGHLPGCSCLCVMLTMKPEAAMYARRGGY